MSLPYHTLCIYDPEHERWFDSYGDYIKSWVREEYDTERANGHPAKHLKIITHDGTAQDMIAKIDALPKPWVCH